MQLYCKNSAAPSSTKNFSNFLMYEYCTLSTVNSAEGNFVYLLVTAVFAYVLTEKNSLISLTKNTVEAPSQQLFSDIITAAKHLV